MLNPTQILLGTTDEAIALEQRRPRRRCNLRVTCHAIVGPYDLRCRGTLIGVSPHGGSLITDLPFERGTILALHVRSATGEPLLNKLLVVTRLHAGGDGRWLVGGCFAHALSRKQMERIAPTTPVR
jgi:hypothetical protein